MRRNEYVNVILWGDVIGRLLWDDVGQVATFQFSERYHELKYNIQPTKPRKQVSPFLGIPGDRYHGLPPFIADSLPDNWGSMVFDRWASENGIQPRDCNPLFKLSYIGRRGIGALEYEPEVQTGTDSEPGSLSRLESLAQKTYRERNETVIHGSDKDDIEILARLGSQPGGAHSKVLIAISDTDDSIISGQAESRDGFTQYILKFKEDYAIPSSELEYIYYLMARKAGIEMMPSRLVTINGSLHFMTQRFDRNDGNKLLTQTMAALTPDALDYENLFFLCRTLRLTEKERRELYRRMCFNVVAGNTDDHNKNFSFIMFPDGHWELAPAYDITYTAGIGRNSGNRIHSLGISSKRSHLTTADLITFGHDFEIENPEEVLKDLFDAVSGFRVLAVENGLPEKWVSEIGNSLEEIFPERDKARL